MPKDLKRIIVSGASGTIGRHFIEAVKERFIIYAIARRSQIQAGIDPHPNIQWIQVDIGDWASLKKVMFRIKEHGSADCILHLAAYYDFSYKDNPEYNRTNVNGTRHMLEQAKWLCVRHFIFISSLTVSKFPLSGKRLDEQSLPDAEFPYARSKRLGEEMAEEYATWFSVSIVRLAAVFSDWCEYGPLYKFLCCWLSNKWNARILAGHGESSITYIHINDLIKLFLKIIQTNSSHPLVNRYIASPNDPISHRELFEIATRYYWGKKIKPVYIPKIFAYGGVISRNLWGRLVGQMPFEQLWMLQYVDKKLEVDSFHTQKVLSWQPTPRYRLKRRLLFLIEKMKIEPYDWQAKNEAIINRDFMRPNLMIYEGIMAIKDVVISKYIDYLLSPDNKQKFKHYAQLEKNDLSWSVNIIYQFLAAAVRTGDRMLMLNYIQELSVIRHKEGFSCSEVYHALLGLNDIVTSLLQSKAELRSIRDQIYDYVSIPIQFALDEIEDLFERIEHEQRTTTDETVDVVSTSRDITDLENLIRQLDIFYQPIEDNDKHSKTSTKSNSDCN